MCCLQVLVFHIHVEKVHGRIRDLGSLFKWHLLKPEWKQELAPKYGTLCLLGKWELGSALVGQTERGLFWKHFISRRMSGQSRLQTCSGEYQSTKLLNKHKPHSAVVLLPPCKPPCTAVGHRKEHSYLSIPMRLSKWWEHVGLNDPLGSLPTRDILQFCVSVSNCVIILLAPGL